VRALLTVDICGRGKPLVLVHGLATNRSIWDLVAPRLAVTRQVVTLDLPGFGESAPAGPGYHLDRVADRIARGLAARNVAGPFDLVGHSLGAGVATALAAHRPAAVRRLVLVAPAGFGAMPPRLSWLLGQGAVRLLALRRSLAPLADLEWGRRLLLAGAAADGARIPPTMARRMVAASASSTRTAEAMETIAQGQIGDLLRRVRAPLGLIWGTADRTVPGRHLDAVLRVRPDAGVELLDGAGHVPMIEQPEAFVAALERLLQAP